MGSIGIPKSDPRRLVKAPFAVHPRPLGGEGPGVGGSSRDQSPSANSIEVVPVFSLR